MNQLSSLEYGMYQVGEVKKGLQDLINLTEKQIAEFKASIEKLMLQDEKLKERAEKILKIKGLGILTLATIIAETNGFELFENERQLCSYAGYDVVDNQSGKRVGRTRISKKGNSHIRRIMFLPALSVVRYGEPRFVELYNRIMTRNTKKMVAYVAIQRKLLCLVYTLWKKNEAYDSTFGQISENDESKPLFSLGFEKAV
jgi:transposase